MYSFKVMLEISIIVGAVIAFIAAHTIHILKGINYLDNFEKLNVVPILIDLLSAIIGSILGILIVLIYIMVEIC